MTAVVTRHIDDEAAVIDHEVAGKPADPEAQAEKS
jgi:hypothetical protein